MDTVGKRLRHYRKARGWKQQTLADKSGIAQNTVSAIETGARDGTLEVLQALAGALEIPVSVLIDDTLPELPGTEDLPAPFATAIQRARNHLNTRQWEMAAAFLDWLAAQSGEVPTEPAQPYAYGATNKSEPANVNEHDKTA